MIESGAAAGPSADARDHLPRMSADGANGDLLRMGELAEASGVPAPTIKHYLREGLLPEPVKTSRNMAYYPPEFVDRIKLIKQLQEERFMPLKAIKSVLDEDPERARALVELEDRILDRALAGERTRTSAAEVRERYGVPKEVLDRLEELEVLSPNSRGYSPSDVKIIEAISRFRAGGYDEEIGFTVYDTLRYKSAIEELVREEVGMVMERLAGEVPPGARRRDARSRRPAPAGPDRRPAHEADGRRARAPPRSRHGHPPAEARSPSMLSAARRARLQSRRHIPEGADLRQRSGRCGSAEAPSVASPCDDDRRSRARRGPCRSRSCTPG